MLKKAMVWSWLLLGLTGCLEEAGTKDGTSTGNNDSTNPDDDGNEVPPGDGDAPPAPGDGDVGDGDGDVDPPADETPVDPDPTDDAGTTPDPDPTPDAGGDDPTRDASTTGPGSDGGGDTQEPDAGAPPVPDAGGEEPEEDAGPPIEVPDLGGADMTDADRAARVFAVMTEQNYKDTWQPFLQETTGPRALVVTPSHGNAVRMWINPVAYQAVQAWKNGGMPLPLVMPNGSIVVKEIYKLDMATGKYSLTGTNVMSKVTALDAATFEGQWFYSKVSPANETSASTTCTNCHNGRTAKAVWPADPNVPGSGGLADGVVPYDYLFVAYCADPNTPQCGLPGGEIDLPLP